MRKEIPILFSTLMVQAMLAGRKTMTRRVIKNATGAFWDHNGWFPTLTAEGLVRFHDRNNTTNIKLTSIKCPYGMVGDVLYVRESHFRYGSWRKNGTTKKGKQGWAFKPDAQFGKEVRFEDNKSAVVELPASRSIGWYRRSSLFLPKEASRIWLQVESVRVERLQDISEGDAIDEGILTIPDSFILDHFPGYYHNSKRWEERKQGGVIEKPPVAPAPSSKFRALWQSLHGKESWDANPWLWVVGFKVLSTTGRPAFLAAEPVPIDGAMIGVPETVR